VAIIQLLSQGLPDDAAIQSAALHFPLDCRPDGRAHVFLLGLWFQEQAAKAAAADTSSLEEALGVM